MKYVAGFCTFLFLITFSSFSNAAPDSFADLADRLLPSVVNISTTQKVVEQPRKKRRQRNPFPNFPQNSPLNDFMEQFFQFDQRLQQRFEEDTAENTDEELREYDRPNSLGSGFIIDAEKGYIVTNNHVLEGADNIQVTLFDDTVLDATLVGKDDKTDVALLQVETDIPLTAVPWGQSDQMRVGDWVLAIGNPFGLGGTVTAGIISARQRDINAGPYDDFIQTDASINQGNSGGPMFNLQGEVIGINTAIYSPTGSAGGSVGIGFAIPSIMARSVVNQLIEFGRTRRGWIGVRIQPVTDDIAQSFDLKKAQGALVANVIEDGPAEKANIKAGDIILSFGNQKVRAMKDLPRIVAESGIDKDMPIRVWRDGKVITLTINVGELEVAEEQGLLDDAPKEKLAKNSPDSVTIDDLGLTFSTLNDELRKQFNFDPKAKGVIVSDVLPTREAGRKNIVPGMRIVEFNQQSVKTPQDVLDIYNKALKDKKRTVLFLFKNGNVTRFVALKLRHKR